MSTLQWSESLVLGLPFMDDTHEEFVDLLAQVVKSTDTELLAKWHALIEHTDVHFGQEDHWMQSTRFSSSNCHSMQHKVILQVMRPSHCQKQRFMAVVAPLVLARRPDQRLLRPVARSETDDESLSKRY